MLGLSPSESAELSEANMSQKDIMGWCVIHVDSFIIYTDGFQKDWWGPSQLNPVQSRAAAETHLIWDLVMEIGVPEDHTRVPNLVPDVPSI